MYTSDKKEIKNAAVYLLISLALALFGAVYEHFSFGVYSNFMIYAFAIPLIGGTGMYLLRYLRGQKALLGLADSWLYHAAIATFTVGSVIHGILAICGRPNSLTIVYLIAGIALLAASAISTVLKKKNGERTGKHMTVRLEQENI